MSNNKIPFNISLLQLTPEITSMIRPVKSLDTYVSTTKNFHEDGLYSTQTFGTVGSEARFKKFGYIDLKISIFHPIIFDALLKLKSLYGDIVAGREFAIWDTEIHDFTKSNAIEGKTGFEFFVEHWKKIEFVQRDSIMREQNIAMIDKFKQKTLTDKIIVMPAAYRDMEVDDNGRESSDEINSLYYKLIAISNTINPSTVSISPEAYNSQRMSLQNTFNEIYDTILKIIEGKKNLFMGKWASRKIFNGTRNVITSMDTAVQQLNAPGNITMNDTVVGLYQCMKAMLPITKYHVKNGFLSTVFSTVGAPALLTDKKTLMSTRVNLTAQSFDQWMTSEGMDSIITSYKEPSARSIPISIEDYYLGLIYLGPDGTFKLIHGIDELPSDRKKEDCKPLTLMYLFFCSMYSVANNYPGYVTRYPIAGPGSIYASKVYMRATVKSEVRKELDNDWKPIEDKIAKEFPTDSDYFNALSPHSTRLAALVADFDGKQHCCQ